MMPEDRMHIHQDDPERDGLRLFRSVMNSLDALVYVTDPTSGEIVFANGFTVSRFGDCIGKRCWEALTDLTAGPCPHCPMGTRGIGDDGPELYIHEYQSPLDGRWYDYRSQLIEWPDGRLMNLQIAFDITDLKLGLKEAREMEMRFAALADASLEAVFLSEEGKCVGQNLAAREMFGYTDSEAIGQPGTNWIAKQDRRTVLKNMLSGRERPYFVTALRKDGTTFPCRIIARESELGEHPIRITVLRDVSREMEMEDTLETLRRSRTFLADAQSLAGMGSWIRDRVTGRRTWSDEMYKLTGLDRGTELDDSTVDSIIHPEDIDGFREAVALAEDQVRTMVDHEFRVLLPDGSAKIVHCRIRIEYDLAGKPLRQFGILHDITSQKELIDEKLELERRVLHAQKLESLGVLAGGIAHDFNNLLMGILGNADLALHDAKPGTLLHDRLTQLVRSSSHAAALSRQMLEYSGKSQSFRKSIDLDALVSGMDDLLRTSVSKRVGIEYRLDGDLPAIVADPNQVSQVVMNLAINASEAYSDGSGTVSISTYSVELDESAIAETEHASWQSMSSAPSPGRYVILEVADSGDGMLPEVREKIFDPFFSTKFTGRGLGMAVLLGIVRSHSGLVSIRSEPGSGSVFRVYLPISHGSLAEAPSSTKIERNDLSEGMILIVDDEETVRSIVSSMLERAGYQVICASDGEEAVEIYSLRHAEISCVILDMTMPRMSGETCFGLLRTVRPDVRVLISSGYDREDVTGRFTGDSLAGFIQKPYRYADLLQAVTSALNNPWGKDHPGRSGFRDLP